MDDTDNSILTAIQAGLPVEERPFDALAARLGVEADELIRRTARLVADGLIRRLGPIFDSRRLGYVSTLVAARVPPERLAEVAARITRLPGVTHNYERRHAYNLWFTLTAPSADALERILETLRRETGIPDFHNLPALAVYKIRVQFDLSEDVPAAEQPAPRAAAPAAPLSEEQKELVRLIQNGIAIEHEPFAPVAKRLGWPVERVVAQVRDWAASGVIRRFGAVVRHRELGFHANGMAVFRVPPERNDEVGPLLAKHRDVSHCYRRPPLAGFPYNLFAMVHGKSEDEVRRRVARMAEEAAAAEYDVLFSATEFKKVSMQYFLEDKV